MEPHRSALHGLLSGVGGIVAMFTLEKFNAFLGTVAGLLTVTHLSIQIFKALRRKK